MNRESFLALGKLKIESVTVGGEIYHVRAMNGRERDGYEVEQLAHNGDGKPMDNFRARLVCRCACDETGQRLFADEDSAQLGEVDASIVGALFKVASRLNGLEEEDAEKK